jgi:hypothetical protein
LSDDVLRIGVFLPPFSKQAAGWANLLCDRELNNTPRVPVVTIDDYYDRKLSSFFTDAYSFAIIGDHQINVETQNPYSHRSPVHANTFMPTRPTLQATPQFFRSSASSVQTNTVAASNNVNGNNTHYNSLCVIPMECSSGA